VHYVEAAPRRLFVDSLHSAVVEIVVKRARCRYTTSRLVEQRLTRTSSQAGVDDDATMEWVEPAPRLEATMKYPLLA